MNPTPAQVAAIKTFVAWLSGGFAGNTDAQIRAAMASTLVANPVATQPTVAKPFEAADLANACSQANRAALAPLLAGSAAAMIVAQDVPHLSQGIDALAAIGSISPADATAMKAVMTATQADPSWTAQVAWDVANIRPSGADDFDIEAARHG